jgi:hypothetical protein
MSADTRGWLREVQNDDDPLTALKIAAVGARFTLHCALLGYKHDEDAEGIEMASESIANLTKALAKAFAPEPPPPICSGCSPIEPFEAAGTP